MCQFMSLQMPHSVEVLFTLETGIRFLARMNSLMFFESTVMPIKKDDPNSEKEDLKKTRFFRNRRPKEDLY